MSKITVLNDETFETIKSKKTMNYINYLDNHLHKDLYDCYERPSNIKQEIYNYWMNWCYEMFPNVSMFGITSYNTFCFTLGGILYDDNDNILGYIEISKCHNRLYLIK